MIHVNALLALAAALLWGGADFSGGMGVGAAGGKTGAALRVVLLSHISSLAVLLAIILVRHEGLPHGALLAWGLLAGFCAAVSLTSFYMALSRGAMGASAAVSGLLAAAIPAAVSMAVEGAPTPLRLAGFLVAAVAIWMIAGGPAHLDNTASLANSSANPTARSSTQSTMVLAIIAGVGFGVYFTALRMANPLGVFMPMALARVGSLVTCSLAFLWLVLRGGAGTASTFTRKVALWAIAAGALDTTGNLLFIAATRAGRLDVAAVLASLYPASTIVLAGWLLKERLSRRQVAGMLVALAAVVMITV
jgi:drug/metabolite transporter (DMT)-like permease